ncbi:MAG: hypothetical protein FIA99_14175 [Ruminiclostridium sp.]|nr:hypothetical protein [Ruminiclostridium sp.]
MKLNPFSLIEELINEHGSSSILRERLLLLKDELRNIEKERTELKTKISELMKENAECRKQLDKQNIPDQFTEYLGALFKRDPSGRYAPVAHCPECKRPLWNNEPQIFPYECSTPGCGYTIMIHESLTSIVDKLNKK